MPQKLCPKCVQCEKLESIMWRSLENGQICNDCYETNRESIKSELEPSEGIDNNGDEKKLRKSTRSTRFKSSKTAPINSKVIPKGGGRSRRCIFKKTPFKLPTQTATTQTCESLFYKVNQQYFLK